MQVDMWVCRQVCRQIGGYVGKQVGRYVGRQVCRQVGMQVSRYVSRQVGGYVGKQVCKQVCRKVGRQNLVNRLLNKVYYVQCIVYNVQCSVYSGIDTNCLKDSNLLTYLHSLVNYSTILYRSWVLLQCQNHISSTRIHAKDWAGLGY